MDLQFKKSVEVLYIAYFISVSSYSLVTRANGQLQQFIMPAKLLLTTLTRRTTALIILSAYYTLSHIIDNLIHWLNK